jgi:hypothetical protein
MIVPLAFDMPLRTASGCNNREHHFARASRVKRERAMTASHLALQGYQRLAWLREALPLRITLTRVSPRAKWLPLKRCWQSCDDDAVPAALKGVRDEIAAWLGLDDGDERLSFVYSQDKGRARAVRVRIEALR